MEKITSLCTFIVRKCTSTAPPPRSAFRTTKSPFQDGVFNLTNPIAYSRIITFLIVMVALAMPTESIAQCESSPAECRPDMVVGHGTDPCNAKVYCSNSGAVESGLINCTNAADTDGCGIDASSDAVADITTIQFANASLSTQALFNGGQCSTGNYLQWIVFATPPTVKGTKIQAVGASDSWWLFHAGSFTSPGDYATVLDALSDPARCANFDAGDLVACSDNNQYEAWVNPNADIGTDVYNVYYIALFYDAPTNGSLNFKVKECEIEDCIPLTTACPDDVIEPSCQTQTDINNSFQTFLDGFVASGNPNQNPVINWYKDGVLQPGKPTVADAPDACGGMVTIKYTISDACNFEVSCERKFTVLPDDTKPVIVDPDDIDITVCNADWPEKVTTTWSDNCTDATGSILEGVAGAVMDGADGCSQYRDYTFNVTDDCGNAADEVTVRVTRPYDKTKPVFNELEDIEVCDGEPIVLPTPVVTDNCSSSGEIVVNNDAPAVFPVGTTTVTWTATDACGNGAQTSIKVTVNPNPSCDIALVEDYGTSLKLGVTGFGGTPGYTYQWLKDGVEIFGETGETIIVSQAGVYSVKITDSKGCSSSCSYTVSQDCGTSWARAQNGSSVCNNTFGCASPNWGWTTQISPSDTPYTFDLLEGAPNECNGNGSTGDLVGTVTVYYNGGTPIVNIETTDGQHFITEWHVHTSCTDPLPTNKKGKCFASPGQFGCAGYENNETQLYNVLDNCRKAASCSGDMWISIHAVTCDLVPEEETLGLSVAKSTAQPFDRPDETIALTTNDTTLEASVPESTIVEAFPLPFENELNVKLSIGYKAQVNVELFDLRGRLIHKSDTYEVSPGVNVLQLPLGRMPSELYIMQVNTGKEILVKKVLSD